MRSTRVLGVGSLPPSSELLSARVGIAEDTRAIVWSIGALAVGFLRSLCVDAPRAGPCRFEPGSCLCQLRTLPHYGTGRIGARCDAGPRLTIRPKG